MTPGLLVTDKVHLSRKGKSIFADARVTRSSRESFKLDLERKRDKPGGSMPGFEGWCASEILQPDTSVEVGDGDPCGSK